MTAQLVTPPRYGKRKRAAQIGVSATTFLALSIWIGPTAACWLIGIAAFIVGWAWLGHRSPTVGYLSGVFFNSFVLGLISGLFGYRSGYAYRSRYRRRRR